MILCEVFTKYCVFDELYSKLLVEVEKFVGGDLVELCIQLQGDQCGIEMLILPEMALFLRFKLLVIKETPSIDYSPTAFKTVNGLVCGVVLH